MTAHGGSPNRNRRGAGYSAASPLRGSAAALAARDGTASAFVGAAGGGGGGGFGGFGDAAAVRWQRPALDFSRLRQVRGAR
eukprot:SAG22_NODE_6555_length_839_cov_1.100000_1_plen_81_part_00